MQQRKLPSRDTEWSFLLTGSLVQLPFLLPSSRSQFALRKIILRRNAERISDTVEESEQRRDIDRLSDLLLSPAGISQFLHVLSCRAIRGASNQLHVFH